MSLHYSFKTAQQEDQASNIPLELNTDIAKASLLGSAELLGTARSREAQEELLTLASTGSKARHPLCTELIINDFPFPQQIEGPCQQPVQKQAHDDHPPNRHPNPRK